MTRLDDDLPLLVTVSRLAIDLKLDALVQAIDAVDMLAGRRPVQLRSSAAGPPRPRSTRAPRP